MKTMSDDTMNGSSVAALLGSLALLAGSFAPPVSAQGAGPDQPIARDANDAALVWGPCPDFMPAGCALSVLRGDPAKPNADVFFKVPAGSTLPVHWHTSAERMVLIAGELHVTFAGQQPAVLKPGTYAYGPAKRAHGGACVSATPCILFIAFEAPVDAIAGDGD
jgi:quercetin dioxygenase-like cupin family protein